MLIDDPDELFPIDYQCPTGCYGRACCWVNIAACVAACALIVRRVIPGLSPMPFIR